MELFGINGSELLVLALIAVVVLGPEKLPGYTQKLATFIKSLRGMAENAKERLREEGGDELADLDWKKLDPRQYDPRKIIRDALLDDAPTPAPQRAVAATAAAAGAAAASGGPGVEEPEPGTPAPFDDEAT